MRVRAGLVVAHRWAGLAITPVALVTAVTGTVLAVRPTIEPLLAPAFVATPRHGAGIDPIALRDRAAATMPGYRFDEVRLDREAGSWSLYAAARQQPERTIEIAFDPDDGRVLAFDQDRTILPRTGRQIMRFLLDLHVRLAIPGEIGTWIFGLSALLWTIDCFIGAALTLPRARRGFWRHWWTAWHVKPDTHGFRRHLDLHRTGGLWLWGLLFVFAWSSVWQNLTTQIYQPTMRALGFTLTNFEGLALPGGAPLAEPSIGFRQAVARGRAAITADGAVQGYGVEGPYRIRYDPARGTYRYQERTSRDPGHYPAAAVDVDARSGRTGTVQMSDRTVGDWVTNWLGSIHTADVSGSWFRWVVAVFGFATGMITVTGLLVWYRKRASAQSVRHRRTR